MKPWECPVLLISIDSATEKRQKAVASLEQLGLDRYQWVRAVDGSKMSAKELRREYRPENSAGWFEPGDELSVAEVGCYLSHLKCHRMICEQNLPYAMVMEDDIRPTPTLLKVLAQSERFPADWGLIHLAPSILDRNRACRRINHRHKLKLFDDHYISIYSGAVYHTHLYLITQQYARKLAKHLQPIRIAIDHAMFDTAFTMDYPYLVYRATSQNFLTPSTYHIGAPSEIAAMDQTSPAGGRGRAGGRIPRKQLKPRLPFSNSKRLRTRLIQLIGALFRLAHHLPWSNAKKTHYLRTGYPSQTAQRTMVLRSCLWYAPVPPTLGRAWQNLLSGKRKSAPKTGQ